MIKTKRNSVIRFFAIICAALMCFLSVSCGGANKKDPTKTYLYVYNFDGGIGTEWLYNAASRFEKLYAGESFEAGKTGVKIEIGPGKATLDTISKSPYNVFFSENVFYNDFIANGKVLDITDIVRNPLSDVKGCEETGNIEKKLFEDQAAALTALNGKYYFLPHYECYPGISYDRDLFNKKSFFIAERSSSDTIVKFTDSSGNLSVGPDGIRNTYDDGLPSSYEEFYAMMNKMVKYGVDPFIYTGQYSSYINYLLTGLWSAYSGKDAFMLNVNFNSGTGENAVPAKIVTGFNGDMPIIEDELISANNGYLMSQEAGRFYALSFLSTIMANSRYFSTKITDVLSHLEAQTDFVFSSLDDKPIAMIIEGSYWYNEAKDALKASANQFPETGVDRDFSIMPLPRKITGQVKEGEGTKNTLMDCLASYCFINANIKDNPVTVRLAKTFLQFLYTDAELINFTNTTAIYKAVKYNISENVINNMSKFGKHLSEIRAASDIIRPYSSHPIYVNAQSKFWYVGVTNAWNSKVKNNDGSITDYVSPLSAYRDKKTAIQYFNGINVTQKEWSSLYGKYFLN